MKSGYLLRRLVTPKHGSGYSVQNYRKCTVETSKMNKGAIDEKIAPMLWIFEIIALLKGIIYAIYATALTETGRNRRRASEGLPANW